MKIIRQLGFAAALLLLGTFGAKAQGVLICYQASSGLNCQAVSATSPLPVTGSFSASSFLPSGNYSSPLSVSNSSANVALPSGSPTSIAVYNTGSQAAYCKLGTTNAVTATTSDDLIPGNSAVGYAVGSNAYLACITATSTTTVNISGGSGQLTGFGGGGSSGGGGAVTIASGGVASGAYASGAFASGAVASGAYASGAFASGAFASGSGTDGWDVTMGAKADAAWVSGSGSLVAIAKTIANNTGASVPAGTALIGKVGIDQTTFGSTNGFAPAANTYNTIAASQSAQAMTGGSGGATGDFLSHCVVVPTSTSPGVVTILDNSTAIYSFPGGSSSLSNLVPFAIPVGAKSTSGAWKVTTGASLSVVCVGKFT